MDNSYKTLFIEMCKSATVLAERVMDYDKKQNDEKGYQTAEMMRNDYQRLSDLLIAGTELTYNDYVKLLAAGYMVVNNLQSEVEMQQKAIRGYKTNILPKLNRIMEETKDKPEEMAKLVEELFKNPEA